MNNVMLRDRSWARPPAGRQRSRRRWRRRRREGTLRHRAHRSRRPPARRRSSLRSRCLFSTSYPLCVCHVTADRVHPRLFAVAVPCIPRLQARLRHQVCCRSPLRGMCCHTTAENILHLLTDSFLSLSYLVVLMLSSSRRTPRSRTRVSGRRRRERRRTRRRVNSKRSATRRSAL